MKMYPLQTMLNQDITWSSLHEGLWVLFCVLLPLASVTQDRLVCTVLTPCSQQIVSVLGGIQNC